MKDVWWAMNFLNLEGQSGIDLALTCFRFTIFVIRLCKAIMTSVDANAYCVAVS